MKLLDAQLEKTNIETITKCWESTEKFITFNSSECESLTPLVHGTYRCFNLFVVVGAMPGSVL